MSMTFGGINDYGFILNSEDFRKLIMLVDKKILGLDEEDSLGDFEEWDLQDISTNIGFEQWYVSQASFDRLIEIDLKSGKPCFNNSGLKNYDFDDENVYIMIFRKDNLVKKYENFDEIVQEIRNDLVKNLNISIKTIEEKLGADFIENHIGLLNGYYYC